jgi:hypothetical protein
MTHNLDKKLRQAGYEDLVDNYGLKREGILHLFVPAYIGRPVVLTPESAEPSGGCKPYRLSAAQHREILHLIFGGLE